MTNDRIGLTSGMTALEQAKAEIFGPEQLYAPSTLVILATSQLIPVIRTMEELLVSAAGRIDSTAYIHMSHVGSGYIDDAVRELESTLDDKFFSKSCERFVERYSRILTERGFTAPSPA